MLYKAPFSLLILRVHLHQTCERRREDGASKCNVVHLLRLGEGETRHITRTYTQKEGKKNVRERRSRHRCSRLYKTRSQTRNKFHPRRQEIRTHILNTHRSVFVGKQRQTQSTRETRSRNGKNVNECFVACSQNKALFRAAGFRKLRIAAELSVPTTARTYGSVSL